jgi:hypothetical protein
LGEPPVRPRSTRSGRGRRRWYGVFYGRVSRSTGRFRGSSSGGRPRREYVAELCQRGSEGGFVFGPNGEVPIADEFA